MKEKRRAGEPEGGRRPSGGSPREEEWPLEAHNGPFPPRCTSCSVQLRHTLT